MTAMNTNTMSLLDFFQNDVPSFAIVENVNNGVRSAYTGRFERRESTGAPFQVKLFNLEGGNIWNLPLEGATAENWRKVRDADGDVEMLPDATRNLLRVMFQVNTDLDSYRSRFRKAEMDWEKLGELLMSEANDRQWCSEYDKLVNEWNADFSLFELPIRKSTYNVDVTITATYTVTVQVEAADDDEAIDQVNDMDAHDIMRQSSGSFTYPDDTEFEVNEANKD